MSTSGPNFEEAAERHLDTRQEIQELRAKVAELEAEKTRLQEWVNDLQAGMYINCVYCGHRYGPDDDVPAAMADVLKEHIESCPKHPMSQLKREKEELKGENERLQGELDIVTTGGDTRLAEERRVRGMLAEAVRAELACNWRRYNGYHCAICGGYDNESAESIKHAPDCRVGEALAADVVLEKAAEKRQHTLEQEDEP